MNRSSQSPSAQAARAHALYELARALGAATTTGEVARAIAEHGAVALGAASAALDTSAATIEALEDSAEHPGLGARHAARRQEGGLVIPCVLEGRVVAAIVLTFRDVPELSAEEVAIAKAVGRQCAQALDRIELVASERAARAELAAVIDGVSDCLVSYDRGWRVTWINEPARQLFVASGVAENPVGRVLWELFPGYEQTSAGRWMRRAMDERELVVFDDYIPATAVWYSVRVYPTPTGVTAFWADTTPLRRSVFRAELLAEAGRALATEREPTLALERLGRAALPEFADFATVDLIGADGVVRREVAVHVSPEKERLMRRYAERFVPGPANRTSPTARALFEEATVFLREIDPEEYAALASGEEHAAVIRAVSPRSLIASPLVATGHVVGVITFGMSESSRRFDEHDILLAEELARRSGVVVENARLLASERIAREEAEGANRAKMEFLTTMSHELRTPLNAIAGFAQLLEMGVHGPLGDAQRDAVLRIQRSGHHLLGLINDVLNYAKLEAGRVEVRREKVDLHDAVDATLPFVGPQAREKGIAIEHAGCAERPIAVADRDKVQQVVLNLLSNAVRYTPAGGRVTVRCELCEPLVLVRVHDTGPGIPAAKLDDIFEPFVQLGRSLSSMREGTGLGLAISRDLARAMGGEISVSSTVGEGSEFVLELPAADGSPAENGA